MPALHMNAYKHDNSKLAADSSFHAGAICNREAVCPLTCKQIKAKGYNLCNLGNLTAHVRIPGHHTHAIVIGSHLAASHSPA